MDKNTTNNQPPTPPSKTPADIFDESGERTSGYQAIDLHAVNEKLERYAEYVSETRSELESAGEPAASINAIADQIKATQMTLRDFEIAHAEDAVPRTDKRGRVSEVIARLQDPKGFDALATQFEEASKAIDDYFEKHRSLSVKQK